MKPPPHTLVAGLLLAAAVVLPARADTPVRVGGDPQYPPYHYLDVDGNAGGFDMAVLQGIARVQGLSLTYEFGEWGRTLDRLEHGELDVVPMFISVDRRERFLFSRPVMRRHHLLFGRGNERVEDPAQLAGRRVSVQFGGMAWEWLINEQVDAVLHPVNEESLVLVAVARGEADFALLPADIGYHTMATQGLQGLEPVSPAWLVREYAFGVNPARPELVPRLDAGLVDLEASGEIEALRLQWLEPKPRRDDAGGWPGWSWSLLLAVPAMLVAVAYLVAGRTPGLRTRR